MAATSAVTDLPPLRLQSGRPCGVVGEGFGPPRIAARAWSTRLTVRLVRRRRVARAGFAEGSRQTPDIAVVDAFCSFPGVWYRPLAKLNGSSRIRPFCRGETPSSIGRGSGLPDPGHAPDFGGRIRARRRIRRNTPSLSPSWVTCARPGNAAMRCLMKPQLRGVAEPTASIQVCPSPHVETQPRLPRIAHRRHSSQPHGVMGCVESLAHEFRDKPDRRWLRLSICSERVIGPPPIRDPMRSPAEALDWRRSNISGSPLNP